ncbi:MAG: DUF1838 family protein [Pseudomonadota bacterium]
MQLHGLGVNAFDRRSLFKLGAGAGLGLGLGGMAAAPAAKASTMPANAYDLSDPQDNVYAWIKLDGSLEDGKATLGMWDGVVLSVWGQQETIKPLFGFKGFGYSRWFNNGDGTFTKLHKEVGFYSDLATGEIIDTWENPYLGGEKVKVWPVANDPVNIVFKPKIEGGYDKTFKRDFVLPWYTHDDKWISTSLDVNLRWPNILDKEGWQREHTGKWIRVAEYFQLHAERAKVMDPDVPDVSPTGGWQRVGNYLPWMLMEERPGHLVYRANTIKLPRGVEQLPKEIIKAAEKDFPDYLEPPKVWTEPNVSSFEVYKRDAKPVPFAKGQTPYQPVDIPASGVVVKSS